MDDNLPNEFDLIVIGTGFPESCVAAAASRIGKKVLHIDQNDFYGGTWASFSLENLNSFFENYRCDGIKNASYRWHIEDSENVLELDDLDHNNWSKSKLLESSRRFNIDLCPKILFAAGRLVQLLISSNICRYAEFRAVDNVCTLYKGNLIRVPCSRSDIFNSKDLTIVEKRLLMKFLNLCIAYEEDDKCMDDSMKYNGISFCEYLKHQKLTDKVITCIIQAIAMCTEKTSFEVGMERTKQFLKGLGRYGNTPFLYPMYGCGEIPQCFCRLCAVFGGIYCLNREITEINIDANNVTVLMNSGEVIKATHLVCSHNNLTANLRESNIGFYGYGELVNNLSRGIFITSSPLIIKENDVCGGGINLLRLVEAEREAFLIQQSAPSATCPKGTYVFQITTPAITDSPEVDLHPFTEQVFNDKPTAPHLLYSAFFTLTKRVPGANSSQIDSSSPILCTSSAFYELDYDQSIRNAEEIFLKLYSDTKFLPRAPDPEEILVDGEDPLALSENTLPDDLRAHLHALEASTNQMDIQDNNENFLSENIEN